MEQLFLKSLVDYNSETGVFLWKKRPLKHFFDKRSFNVWNSKHSGNAINNPDQNGYLYMNLDGKRYPLHRLAWLYVYGEYVDSLIDHKDGDKSNNRIKNIRKASYKQNNRSQKLKKTNTSGFKGVHFSKQKGKWVSFIRTDNGRLYLGSFKDKVEAALKYDTAALEHHGEFALTNKMMGLYND